MVSGIDVSDKEMVVAYPIGAEQLEARSFDCFTSALHTIAKTLQKFSVTSVAMESTCVYWVSLFLLLQEYGFEGYLVNAKHVQMWHPSEHFKNQKSVNQHVAGG